MKNHQFLQYIDGRMMPGDGREYDVVCPGNEKIVGTFTSASAQQAEQALQAAQNAFPRWSKLSLEERGA